MAATTVAILQEVFGSALRGATDLLYQVAAVKTPVEISRLRRANEVACLGLEAFKAEARPGRTEAEIAAAVEAAIYAQGTGHRGARYARGWAQVMSGPNTETAWFYPISTARKLQPGDLVMIELGTVVDGYWSDLTRTIVADGNATARQREIYETLLDGQQADLIADRPGTRGEVVDAVGRQIIAERGFGQYFVHHTGHGIGFRYHEPYPLLAPGSRHTIAAGNVHSIEPGIYIPGFGGMRVEDDVVVLDSGAEYLSRTTFGLD
jgi:Xaa-Pro aminopeptidase